MKEKKEKKEMKEKKEEKEKNWIKRGNNGFMTSIWALILIVVAIAYFEYYNYNKHFDRIEQNYTKSETNQKLNAVLKKLTQTQDSIQHKEELPYFELQKDFLDVKSEVTSLKSEVEAEKKSFFRIFSSFWGIMGSILGLIAVFFAYKEFMQKAVIKEIAKITGKSIEHIQQNFDQYLKHVNLKKDSKIIVINEKDTKMPNSFKKVINLFPNNEYLELEKLEDVLLDSNIKKLKEAKLVVIENQVHSNLWNIYKKPPNKVFDNYSNKLKEEVNNLNKKIMENNSTPENNIKAFKKLAEQICKQTSLIYYGGGHFPRFDNDEIQENITFANAPSQLYGNMLNMLKFKLETS